ncbi:MAG: DNA polymerase I [Phycisphaeraceae bacterium]|nr:DNA polymerase I [Phycisphaeraceae bacterium]
MAEQSPSLYLIDGHAQIFRAYHAIRGGMNSPRTGETTQAVFGFARMLLKLLLNHGPDYVAVAIDLPGPTFRDEIYPQYKATRDPAPEDLPMQAQRIFELCRLLGIPLVSHQGAEADDCIATLCRTLITESDGRAPDDLHLHIVSRDKDLEQLLTPRITMYDIHTEKSVDVEGLWEKKRIRPEQVLDCLALMGDTVDNIIGVKGVGEKTAAKLIAQYGTIEGIYENLDKLTPKLRENLIEARDRMDLNRKLVRLEDRLPLEFSLEDARISEIDAAGARAFFELMGFESDRANLDRLLKLYADRIKTNTDQPSPQESKPAEVKTPEIKPTEANPPVGQTSAGKASASSTATARSKRKPARDNEPNLFSLADDAEDDSSQTTGGEGSTSGEGARDGDASGALTSGGMASGGLISGGGGGGGMGEVVEAATSLLDDPQARASRGDYRVLATLEAVREAVDEAGRADWLAVDTETRGLGHDDALCGVCLSWRERQGVYVPLLARAEDAIAPAQECLALLRRLLENAAQPKTGHNIKFDYLVLRRAGIRMRGMAFDTMIAAHLLNEPAGGLNALVLKHFDHTMIPIEEIIGIGPAKKQRTMDEAPLDRVTEYAAEDADFSLRLKNRLQPMLGELEMAELAERIEMPLVEVLGEMEHAGITVDPDILDEQARPLEPRLAEIRGQLEAIAGHAVNPDSPKQLAALLFDELGLPVIKRTRTSRSTDIEVLERLVDREDLDAEKLRVPELLIEHRQLAKLMGTYLVSLKRCIRPDTGRIHARFHQNVTATGRLSSSDPNLQQIPIRTDLGRRIRKAFVAAKGHELITADYSQIELRILAHLSGDEALSEAFDKGQDIHAAVAAQVYGVPLDQVTGEQRGHAKTINFGIIYGVTPHGLARRIDGLDVAGARKLIEDYRKRFSGIDRFLEQCVEQASQHGYVTTMFKRRRRIQEIGSPNRSTRALGERLAINTVVQGSAAELIKLAMVQLHRRINAENLSMRILLQIHDELVVEAPEGDAAAMAEVLEETMTGCLRLKVPLVVSAGRGRDWYDTK